MEMTVTATRVSSLMSCRNTLRVAVRVIDRILESSHLTEGEVFESGMKCGRFVLLVQETIETIVQIFPDESEAIGEVPEAPERAAGFRDWLLELQEYFVESEAFVREISKRIDFEDGDMDITDEAIWDLIDQG